MSAWEINPEAIKRGSFNKKHRLFYQKTNYGRRISWKIEGRVRLVIKLACNKKRTVFRQIIELRNLHETVKLTIRLISYYNILENGLLKAFGFIFAMFLKRVKRIY